MSQFKFQSLEVWQLAIDITDKLLDVADHLSENKRYRFAEQLNGAALSISNNIAEGSASISNKESLIILILRIVRCLKMQIY
jgi:four helix bundle protein